ncbi:MAG: putative caspase-like protein [Planctomycetota bacterium]|jgi:uncharacterized caspase-like protein
MFSNALQRLSPALKIAALFALLLPASLLSLDASAAQSRTALVIGNSNYPAAGLKNPVNDARLMTQTLINKGFVVTTLLDAGKREMKESIRSFTRSLDEDSVGLFYFAGHGIEIDGNNYLIPVDAEIGSETDVEFEGVNAGRILSGLKRANNGLNLVVLDACRNNPYSRSFRSTSRGLSRMQPASGSLILYATEPGSVAADGKGDNGVFTEHLVNAINRKGFSIEKVFKITARDVSRATAKKQTPYIEGVVLGDFYFDEEGAAPKASKPLQTASISSGNTGIEQDFWSEVSASPSKEMYQAYLDQYPDGHFAAIARIKLSLLKKQGNSSAAKTKTATKKSSSQSSGSISATGIYVDDQDRQIKLTQKGDEISGAGIKGFSRGANIRGNRSGNSLTITLNPTAGGARSKAVLDISDDGKFLKGTIKRGANTYDWELRKLVDSKPGSFASLNSISGRYTSDITYLTAGPKVLARTNVNNPKLEVVIKQSGDRISGTFSGDMSGGLEGKLEGNTIAFDWYTTEGNSTEGQGEWTIDGDGVYIDGTFQSKHYNTNGIWDLIRQ